jgi:hypothetical protein
MKEFFFRSNYLEKNETFFLVISSDSEKSHSLNTRFLPLVEMTDPQRFILQAALGIIKKAQWKNVC